MEILIFSQPENTLSFCANFCIIDTNHSYFLGEIMTATAKLFWTGNSQAVRLPKEFRFEGKEVRIFKQGNQVIIEPIVDDWDWVNDLEPFDDTMEQAI